MLPPAAAESAANCVGEDISFLYTEKDDVNNVVRHRLKQEAKKGCAEEEKNEPLAEVCFAKLAN